MIVASIVLAIASNIVDPPSSWHSFWLESVGIVSFGVSWLVKGFPPAIWADRQRNQGTVAGARPRPISG